MVGWHHQLDDMSLSRLQELLMGRDAWHAVVCFILWGRRELDMTECLN